MRTFVLTLVVLGCGSSGGGTPDASGARDASDRDAPGEDAPPANPFVPLLSRPWSLAPVTESFFCTATLLTEDLWISGFRPVSSPGTYRQVLYSTDVAQPEGAFDCDATANGKRLLFASGVGTEDLVFPAGIAIHVPAGQYVLLSTHAFNFGAVTLDGETAIEVQTVPETEVTQEAEAFFTGQFNDLGGIPGDALPHPIAADCVFPIDWHVIALWPHMHQYGSAITLSRRANLDTVTTYVDTPYTDQNQDIYPIDMTIPTNDTLHVVCTYVNTSGDTVRLGDGYLTEQCMVATYVVPAQGVQKFFCMNL